jgi:hypothetical protein
MKYIVDIDGTICDRPEGTDYDSSVPMHDRIAKINHLYDKGHQIVYFTARGMGRYNDAATVAEARFYELTEKQLASWGCKYHKLILGKPSGDFYIDDKGIGSDDFFRY